MNAQPPAFDLDAVLAECLEETLAGRRTVADCLARYPDLADDLKPLLEMALLTARLKSPRLPEARVAALETRLRAQMRPQRRPAAAGISRLAAGLLLGFLLAFGSGAGLVAASSSSLPGDPLYGIKRLWEVIVLALSPLFGQLDDAWLAVAETRLDEVQALHEQGRLTSAALDDLAEAARQAARLADADTLPRTAAYLETVQVALRDLTPPPGGEAALQTLFATTLPIAPTSAPVAVTAAPAPTLTPSTTPTLEPTATTAPTDTPIYTPTATLTRTPTPSRTPTATLTLTFTPTPTASPTATWTPLPLPGQPTLQSVITEPAPGQPLAATPTPANLPTLDFIRIRETERAVYMTQTAGPPPTEPP